jgi:hypothetical protein
MTAPIAGASRAAAVTSLTRAAIATGLQQQCFIVRDGKGQALTYVEGAAPAWRPVVRFGLIVRSCQTICAPTTPNPKSKGNFAQPNHCLVQRRRQYFCG